MVELALTEPQQRGGVREADVRSDSTQAYSADVLIGASAYRDIAFEWRRLAEQQSTPAPFQAPEMLAIWARQYGDAGEPVTVVVRDRGVPVLIWPLLLKRRALIRVATGAGAPFSQYDEVLLRPGTDPDAAMKTALAALSKAVRPDLIFLERVRADSALNACLAGKTPTAAVEAAPYADLSQGVEAFMATLKTRAARQQRKRMKHAEQRGVTFEIADDPATAVAWLAEAMALKRDWLRSTGRISRAFASSELESLIADLATAFAAPGAMPRMLVSRVGFDGKTAAIEMGFRERSSYHLYLGAFAPEFAKLGPGNILTQRMLEWCAANGVARYDMLAPRTRNKGEWQSGEVAVLDFALPQTVSGRLYIEGVVKRLAPALRRAFYALPAPLRSRLARLLLGDGGEEPQPSSNTPSEEA
jgi:CelD/BcsL family acetyltransferase involved in cellulose biosynthesis